MDRSKSAALKSEPLSTRHVFLDTQVYRQLRHSPENRAFSSLKRLIDEHKIVLHTSDITLLEIRRQVLEAVTATHREIRSADQDLARWRKAAPKTQTPRELDFDPVTLGQEVFSHLLQFIQWECGITIHKALDVLPSEIFKDYFERMPPFDTENSKEFPDAFVIRSLKKWCFCHDTSIHVVTQDKAFLRSCNQGLIALKDIHDVLARGAADISGAGEEAATLAMDQPAFNGAIEKSIEDQLSELVFLYVGDLAEGEVYDPSLLGIQEIDDFSTIHLNKDWITLIISCRLEIAMDVQFENRDEAFYDKEDGVWFGAEPASRQVVEEITAEFLVEVSRETGLTRNGEFLTREVLIHGPNDYD